MSSQVQIKDYLSWLESQIGENPGGRRDLMYLMLAKEFNDWRIPHDDNRIQDGLDLRAEFCHDRRLRPKVLDNLGGCSFLEVLVALSRHLAFTAGGSAPGWAEQLLNNLELDRMRDPLSPRKADRVNEIMDTVIHRTYMPDGNGGFFPLLDADDDQTQIELWYQMSAYVLQEVHPESEHH